MSTKKDKKLEVRKCPTCGKKFTPAVHNQRYCSKKCKGEVKKASAKKGKVVELKEKISLPKSKKPCKPNKPCKPCHDNRGKCTSLEVFGVHDPLKIIAISLSIIMDMLVEINKDGTVERKSK